MEQTNSSIMTSSATHSQSETDGHWKMQYLGCLGVVERDEKAFYLALESCKQVRGTHYMRQVFDHESSLALTIDYEQKKFTQAALVYASTLFSALNSYPRFIPGMADNFLNELHIVLMEIEKPYIKHTLTSVQKEVVIACYMKLLGNTTDQQLHVGNYYKGLIIKYVDDVFGDEHVSNTTKLMVCARVSMMPFVDTEKRRVCKDEVLQYLSGILKDRIHLCLLDQGWKSYVRLARMVYAWDAMFFGLKRDSSLDLHFKSYLWFARCFYKK